MAAFASLPGAARCSLIRLANYLKEAWLPGNLLQLHGRRIQPAYKADAAPRHPALIERNEWCPDVPVLLEQFGMDVVHSHHASVDVYFASHANIGDHRAYKHIVTMHGMYEAMADDVFDSTMSKLGDEVSTWGLHRRKEPSRFSVTASRLLVAAKIPNGMERPEISPVPGLSSEG